jgi:hypothetical protein
MKVHKTVLSIFRTIATFVSFCIMFGETMHLKFIAFNEVPMNWKMFVKLSFKGRPIDADMFQPTQLFFRRVTQCNLL